MVASPLFPVILMKCIASYIDRAPLVSTGDALIEVAERFVALPALPFLPVAQDGQIVGLIYRRDVDSADSYDTLSGLMLPAPLVVDAKASVQGALDLLLADPRGRDAFVVVQDGDYLGVATLRGVIAALVEGQAPAPVQDEQRIAEAVSEEFHRLMAAADSAFRGQVHGLLAMAERLGRQTLTADGAAQVRSIAGAGETLLRLADDTLDMLRARHGRLELTLQAQPLRDLADCVQERWLARAAESGVSLLISYDGDPDLAAMVDPGRLMQVFDNLVENALRYTRQGSVEVSLRARAETDKVMIEGRVRDTGPGMTGAKLARVFDPDGGPTGEGGSLSLSLTRGIILAMKGSIRAESNVGRGMTIVFGLMAPAAQTVAPVEPLREPASGPHILIVDDNATNRMVAEALCEMFDCTCETVEDGIEAVEAARGGRFDLILMDIKMPRMDGIAATLAIREIPGPAGAVPIVALTANVDPDDARAYLASGMCCVVEKPIKPDRLLQAINLAMASGAQTEAPARVAAA
jgi:signal transduction histidine kinase/AmiR/NasT family two-component response regulator